MFVTFEFWLIVLAALIAYLCVSVGLRWRAEEARRRERERQWPRTAFDASAIAPQIQRVRQEYVAAARTHPQPTHYRARLVAAARRLVVSLGYFEHDKSAPEPPGHQV